jgi:acyl-CoA synthetase
MMLNSANFDAYDLSSLRILFTAARWCRMSGRSHSSNAPAPRAAVLRIERDRRLVGNDARRPAGTSPPNRGRVIPEMQVRLLDAETDVDITATGGPGVPRGKGPTLCLGYWDDAAANRALFTADGWMRMGDLATIDADGYLTVAGRLPTSSSRRQEHQCRGGRGRSRSHPAVALCAVVPMPDATFGERVCVFAELRPAPRSISKISAHIWNTAARVRTTARAPRGARRAAARVRRQACEGRAPPPSARPLDR